MFRLFTYHTRPHARVWIYKKLLVTDISCLGGGDGGGGGSGGFGGGGCATTFIFYRVLWRCHLLTISSSLTSSTRVFGFNYQSWSFEPFSCLIFSFIEII